MEILCFILADVVVIVSIVVLLGLFSIQRFGTSKVAFMFSPVIALWFISVGSIGIYNILTYDVSVLKAFNPAYIYYFFKKNTSRAWSALGAVAPRDKFVHHPFRPRLRPKQ